MKTSRLILLFLLALPAALEAELSVDGDLLERFQLDPGQSVQGALVIRNRGVESQAGRATLSDFRFEAEGGNRYDPPGSHPRSCGPWVRISPIEFTIPPGEELELVYSIQVPDRDSLVGSYWCMVFIEPAPEFGERLLRDSLDDQAEVGIQAVVRHAVQLAVNIGDSGQKEVSIVRKSLDTFETGLILNLDVENTGQRWVNPLIWAEFYDAQGNRVDRQEQQRGCLYPGCSLRQSFPIRLPTGTYEVLVIIDDGKGEAWGAQYSLDIP